MTSPRLLLAGALVALALPFLPATASAAAPTCVAPDPLPVRTGLQRDVPSACSSPGAMFLDAAVITPPQHGALQPTGFGTWVYHPDPAFTGTDAFEYVARPYGGEFGPLVRQELAVSPGVNRLPMCSASKPAETAGVDDVLLLFAGC